MILYCHYGSCNSAHFAEMSVHRAAQGEFEQIFYKDWAAQGEVEQIFYKADKVGPTNNTYIYII